MPHFMPGTALAAPARLLAAILMVAAPVAARADAALQQILAQSARAPVVGFERTTRAEERSDPKKEPAVVVDRFQPSSARAGTWTLVSVDGRKPTEKEVSAHARANAKGPIPGFHRLHLVLGGKPDRQTTADGRTVYHFASLPDGAVVTPGGDISSDLSAEATVEQVNGKPIISRVRIYAAAPFSIAGVARMNSFDVVSQYRLGENGLPFLYQQTSASDVKAPFGMGGKRRSVISFRPI